MFVSSFSYVINKKAVQAYAEKGKPALLCAPSVSEPYPGKGYRNESLPHRQ
jgi:hypothetical protein